jgi:YHS domain-containing protein
MKVDSASPYHATVDGQSYQFCSATCRDRFEANPSQYNASTAGAHSERHEPPHTVTGGFPAPKFGSAGSGGAEYEVLRERHDHTGDDAGRDR